MTSPILIPSPQTPGWLCVHHLDFSTWWKTGRCWSWRGCPFLSRQFRLKPNLICGTFVRPIGRRASQAMAALLESKIFDFIKACFQSSNVFCGQGCAATLRVQEVWAFVTGTICWLMLVCWVLSRYLFFSSFFEHRRKNRSSDWGRNFHKTSQRRQRVN